MELRVGGCYELTVIDPLPKRLKKLSYNRTEKLDDLFSELQELEELAILSSAPIQIRGNVTRPIPWFLPNLIKLEVQEAMLDLPSLDSNLPKLESFLWRRSIPSSLTEDHSLESIEEGATKQFFEDNILRKLKVLNMCITSEDQKNFTFMNYQQLQELTIDGISNSQGLERLPHLRKTSILSCSFHDVSIFRHFHAVTLYGCDAVTDVSSLGCVRKLLIHSCLNLRSLHGLGERNRDVSILFCPQINDESMMLGKVCCLRLEFCPNIIDISSLIHVPYLSLRGCFNINDFNGLGKHQKYLNLTGCKITNDHLYALANVHSLIISFCQAISDLSMLRNERLIARNCQNIMNAHLYGNFLQIDLSRCKKLQNLFIHGHVYALCVNETPNANEVPSIFVFGSLKYLTSEFEQPNQYETGCIQEDDEDILLEEENDESNHGEEVEANFGIGSESEESDEIDNVDDDEGEEEEEEEPRED